MPHNDNPVFAGALDIMEQISLELRPGCGPVRAWLAGGMAVSWRMGASRVSSDVHAILSHRFVIPDICTTIEINGISRAIHFDHNFNSSFSLLQQDYEGRASKVAVFGELEVFVLAPVDLVIMKSSRFTEKDQKDIAMLIAEGLVDRDEFIALADDALIDYIGNPLFLRYNLEEVASLFDAYM